LVKGIVLAIIIRLLCVPNKNPDYVNFLEPWYNFIVEHGGFSALKYSFANYTPPYLYWLVIASSLLSWLPKLLAIKLFAMMVDFVCAFFVYKIVSLKYPEGRRPITAFMAVLFTPTVIDNSALWGQCDVIYTTGLIACLYFLCVRKSFLAFICFGIAFSFKLQAIFFAPVLLILLLKRVVRWEYIILIPSVYLVAILPAWFAGRPLLDLLLIYFNQTNEYKELTMNAPNLYQWINNDYYNIFVPLGLLLTFTTVCGMTLIIYSLKIKISREHIITFATVSVLVVPYLLPKMHERYFYPADVISIVWGFYFPQYFLVPIGVQIASLLSYIRSPILIKIASILLGLTILFVIQKSYLQIRKNYQEDLCPKRCP
jgi:Gpi18-like mannosyltransferase